MSNFHLKVSGLVEVAPNANATLQRHVKYLLETLAEKANFKYSFILPPRNEFFGRQFPNGSWNGSKREMDVIFATMAMTSDRAEVLELSRPLTSLGMAILSGQKRLTSSVQDVFVNLIDSASEVWLVMIALGLVVSLICASSAIDTKTMSIAGILKAYLASTFEYFFLLFGILTDKGPSINPKSSREKLAYLLFLFNAMMFGIYLGSGFSTDLVAMPKMKFIDDREQLVKSKQAKPDTFDGSSFESVLRSTKSGIYADIWKRIESGDGYLFSTASGISVASKVASREIGFIQSEMLLARISWIDQSDIWNVWMRELTVRDIRCFDGSMTMPDQQEQESFKVDSMKWMSITTCAGFAAATIVLFIELCWAKLLSKVSVSTLKV